MDAAALRAVREELGLPRRKAAHLIGLHAGRRCPESTLVRWELTGCVPPEWLPHLARALGTSAGALRPPPKVTQ